MPALESDVLRHPSDQPKVKCFGKSAALTVEATVIQKASTPPLPTINLEVAPRSAERVEWERKIVIQLSDSELPVLCAVLMGYLQELHLKRPGKGIEVARQPDRLFIRATAGAGNMFMLPVTIGDTFRVSALLLSQLKKQSGLADETLLLGALRGAASLVHA
jgi:hypothetical protein